MVQSQFSNNFQSLYEILLYIFYSDFQLFLNFRDFRDLKTTLH